MKTPRAPRVTKKTPIPANDSPAPAEQLGVNHSQSEKPKRQTRKRGTKEEYSARIPRVRQVYSLLLKYQKDGRRKLPTNAEIGRLLQPDAPLGEDTVRAILAMMRDDLGMPVDYIPERGGHGFTEPVAGFPLDVISEEQAYYLIQSVQMLGVHRQSKMFADIRNVVKRACLGICFALNLDFEDIEQALSFHAVGFYAPAPVDPELFKAAMRAILQKQEVTLEHRSVKRRGEVTKKTVEPLHLSMINHALYLWHYDPEFEGKLDEDGQPAATIRKFALTRIGDLKPTKRKFKPREFDVEKEVERGMGVFNGGKLEEVEVRFSAKVAPFILERPLHPKQVRTDHEDDSLTVRLCVPCTPELDAALLRWAGDFEVVGPVSLRKRMRELGEALVEAHKG